MPQSVASYLLGGLALFFATSASAGGIETGKGLEIRGVHLGMSIDQVQAAAKAAGMICSRVNVLGSPGVEALDLRDPGAKAISSSVDEISRMVAAGNTGNSPEKGTEVFVSFSAATHKSMEVKARSFGTETADFQDLIVKKFGKPTSSRHDGNIIPTEIIGPEDSAHAELYTDDSSGWIAGPDSDTYGGFEAVRLIDPAMIKQSENVSHPKSDPPKL